MLAFLLTGEVRGVHYDSRRALREDTKQRVSPKFRWVAQWDKYLWMLALQDEAENRQ